jgi:uncharacterized glyoxalase superfamily protein PhnB
VASLPPEAVPSSDPAAGDGVSSASSNPCSVAVLANAVSSILPKSKRLRKRLTSSELPEEIRVPRRGQSRLAHHRVACLRQCEQREGEAVSDPVSQPQLRGLAPVLLVADVVRAAAYYADKLGFTTLRLWGEPPTFCIARRDGLSVMLNQVATGDHLYPNAGYDGRYDVYFWVRDADALFAELRDRGADTVCAPADQPYLMREFSVRDADGHLLAFGHDTSAGAAG